VFVVPTLCLIEFIWYSESLLTYLQYYDGYIITISYIIVNTSIGWLDVSAVEKSGRNTNVNYLKA